MGLPNPMRDFDRLMNVWGGPTHALLRPASHAFDPLEDLFRGLERDERGLMPDFTVIEAENEFDITADLPGFKREDINVELNDDGVLSIKGQRVCDIEQKRAGYLHVSERRFGSFTRSYVLPKERCDFGKVEALLENGVLTLRIPKKEPAERKDVHRIELKEGKKEVKA